MNTLNSALVRLLLLAVAVFLLTASRSAADELRRRGMLGVRLVPAPTGAGVEQAMPDTPAAKAGLRPGDVIIKVNGDDVSELPQFMSMMRKFYGGDTIKLTVKRGDETIETDLTLAPRPKETSENHEVIYDSCSVGDQRARTLVTRPEGDGRLPAVLMLPSPLPQSSELPPQMARHPFALTIDGFSSAGIVTMRVDRFGVGDSDGGDPQATPFDTDVALYRSAAKRLSQYEFVDPTRVYVFSQGLGSALVPLVAAEPAVRGVISYGSTAVRPWTTGMVEMHRRVWDLETVKADEIDKRAKELEKFLAACAKPGANPRTLLNDYPALVPIADNLAPREDMMLGIPLHYFRSIATTDLLSAWARLDLPVLSLWGEADFQANEADAKAVVTAVNKAHDSRATYKSLPEVDHGSFQADDQEDSYLSGYQGGEYNDVVVQTIIRWIRAQRPKAA